MSVNRYDASTGELTNIAAGQRTWVGTQAAYKSAKQAGTLPNNAIIAITDDEQDHNHYSTEETETGMYWIDGKPIYRKVFTGGKTVANGNIYDCRDLNIQSMVNMTGNFNGVTNINAYAGNNYLYTAFVGGYIQTIASSTWVNISITVILEYTKTTDA